MCPLESIECAGQEVWCMMSTLDPLLRPQPPPPPPSPSSSSSPSPVWSLSQIVDLSSPEVTTNVQLKHRPQSQHNLVAVIVGDGSGGPIGGICGQTNCITSLQYSHNQLSDINWSIIVIVVVFADDINTHQWWNEIFVRLLQQSQKLLHQLVRWPCGPIGQMYCFNYHQCHQWAKWIVCVGGCCIDGNDVMCSSPAFCFTITTTTSSMIDISNGITPAIHLSTIISSLIEANSMSLYYNSNVGVAFTTLVLVTTQMETKQTDILYVKYDSDIVVFNVGYQELSSSSIRLSITTDTKSKVILPSDTRQPASISNGAISTTTNNYSNNSISSTNTSNTSKTTSTTINETIIAKSNTDSIETEVLLNHSLPITVLQTSAVLYYHNNVTYHCLLANKQYYSTVNNNFVDDSGYGELYDAFGHQNLRIATHVDFNTDLLCNWATNKTISAVDAAKLVAEWKQKSNHHTVIKESSPMFSELNNGNQCEHYHQHHHHHLHHYYHQSHTHIQPLRHKVMQISSPPTPLRSSHWCKYKNTNAHQSQSQQDCSGDGEVLFDVKYHYLSHHTKRLPIEHCWLIFLLVTIILPYCSVRSIAKVNKIFDDCNLNSSHNSRHWRLWSSYAFTIIGATTATTTTILLLLVRFLLHITSKAISITRMKCAISQLFCITFSTIISVFCPFIRIDALPYLASRVNCKEGKRCLSAEAKAAHSWWHQSDAMLCHKPRAKQATMANLMSTLVLLSMAIGTSASIVDVPHSQRIARAGYRTNYLNAMSANTNYTFFEELDPNIYFSHFSFQLLNSTTGKVFIGAVNNIYQLDLQLKLETKVVMGPHEDSVECPSTKSCPPNVTKKLSNYYNKALVIDPMHQWLISCGSLYQGTCSTHDLNNVTIILQQPAESVVANNATASTVAFIAPGPPTLKHVLYVGATYTQGNYRSDVPAVSSRSLSENSKHHRT